MGVFLKGLYILVSQLLLGYDKNKKNTSSLVTFPLKKLKWMFTVHGGSLLLHWEKLLTYPRLVYCFFQTVGTKQLYMFCGVAKRSTVGEKPSSSGVMSSIFIAQHMQIQLNKKRKQLPRF